MRQMERNRWELKKLNELGSVGRGRSRHRPRNDTSLYGGPYPFIQTGDIKDANLYVSHYTQTYNENGLAQSKIWEQGTLCITIAANIAETAILKIPACFPDSVVGFVPFPNKANTRFIKYYLDTIKLQMQNISKGTTQDNLSLDKLLSFDILTPPLPTQHKIASILSAYDDLIENNTQRIAILEEMAQSIYQEWFVRFRYPGYEKHRIVESELGMIPEGWEVRTFAAAADFINGYAFKPHHWGKTGKPIVKIAELKNGVTEKTPYHDGSDIPSKYYVQNGDLLFSWSADLDVYIWNNGPALLNQHLFNVLPYPESTKTYLYFALKKHLGEFRSRSQGTTMKHIKRSALDEVKFLLPKREVAASFEQYIDPIFLQIQNLISKNRLLHLTRDLLLPKLISGEIDVEALDIDTPDLTEPKEQQYEFTVARPEPIDATQLALPW